MRTEFFSKKTGPFVKKAWTKKIALVTSSEIMMSLLLSFRERLLLPAVCVAFPLIACGQNAAPQGGEFSFGSPRPGDQLHTSISLGANGGYMVWEENGTSKSGSQISGIRLNSSFSKVSEISVNKIAKGDQHKPKVQLLRDDNAIVVWQGNGLGNSDIYARILKSDGTFATSDVRLNSNTKDQQSEPAVCSLSDGGAFVAWQSFGQDGDMFGIYAVKISAEGVVSGNGIAVPQPVVTTKSRSKKKQPVINEFQINQATAFNQRNPAVATLTNGNVVVAWVSEQERFMAGFVDFNGTVSDSPGSVDIYARLFDSTGVPISDEILINSGNNTCANPSIASLASGGFAVAWSERDIMSRSNNWDVMARSFSSDGVAAGGDFKVNSTTYGDQYAPQITALGNDCAVVWTSMGQDSSWEGVFGRILRGGVEPSGTEFPVNTRTISRQIQPAIASNGENQFLVSWSSFVRVTGLDLYGRKFILNQQQ